MGFWPKCATSDVAHGHSHEQTICALHVHKRRWGWTEGVIPGGCVVPGTKASGRGSLLSAWVFSNHWPLSAEWLTLSPRAEI